MRHMQYFSLLSNIVHPLIIAILFLLQDHWSPLHAASYKGHVEVVKALIEAKAKVNSATKVGTHIFLIIVNIHTPTCV